MNPRKLHNCGIVSSSLTDQIHLKAISLMNGSGELSDEDVQIIYDTFEPEFSSCCCLKAVGTDLITDERFNNFCFTAKLDQLEVARLLTFEKMRSKFFYVIIGIYLEKVPLRNFLARFGVGFDPSLFMENRS